MLDRTPLKDRARGRWKEILPQVAGIDVRQLDGRHHPCPLCGGKDRWRFDDKDGGGSSICGQCGSRSGITLVMDVKGFDYGTTAREIETVIGAAQLQSTVPARPSDNRAARIQSLIREINKMSVRSERGDPVHCYLSRRVPGLKFVPAALRFVARGEHYDRDSGEVTRHPVMVATVSDFHGDPIALHRTYITTEGDKAALANTKLSLGPLPDGVAVRLAKTGETLGIAEGIETALSAMAMHRIPVWAALNANRLEAWTPPEGIRQVVIFGDNDANCTGQSAAFNLARRLEGAGVATQVMIPPQVGTDWNDVQRVSPAAANSLETA